MDSLIIIIFIATVVAALVILVKIAISNTSEKRKVFKDHTYTYVAKNLVMTPTEAAFFYRLDKLVSERYYVFPQVHLSSILDHRVIGQEWKYAFSHINGKSVDYVLCDKETLRPIYAIELDDITHDQPERRKRDIEVERIFKQANLPLIRFKDVHVSNEEIINELSNSYRLSQNNVPRS